MPTHNPDVSTYKPEANETTARGSQHETELGLARIHLRAQNFKKLGRYRKAVLEALCDEYHIPKPERERFTRDKMLERLRSMVSGD